MSPNTQTIRPRSPHPRLHIPTVRSVSRHFGCSSFLYLEKRHGKKIFLLSDISSKVRQVLSRHPLYCKIHCAANEKECWISRWWGFVFMSQCYVKLNCSQVLDGWFSAELINCPAVSRKFVVSHSSVILRILSYIELYWSVRRCPSGLWTTNMLLFRMSRRDTDKGCSHRGFICLNRIY